MIRPNNIFQILTTGLLLAIVMMGPAQAATDNAIFSCNTYIQSVSPENSYDSTPVILLSLSQRALDLYRSAGLKVQILFVVIAYLAISLSGLFFIIMATRARKSRRQKQAEKIKNTYQEELTNFLFGEDHQPLTFTGITQPFNRNIFIRELMSLHNNLHGEAAIKLRDLYFNLNLYKDSLARLNKSRWDLKAKGFREIAQMDVKEAAEKISRHVNSKNPVLRMEAQVALVKLNDDDPLIFLDDLKYELSDWEQVNIISTLDYHQITIDSFERWLKVQNESVVNFAVKMTGLLKHTHAAPALIPLLQHPSLTVRRNTIEAIGRMEMPEYMVELQKAYNRELPVEPKKNDAFFHLNVNKNRKAIIQAISQIATTAEYDFLNHVLQTENDFDILQITARTMASLEPQGIQHLNALYENASPPLRRIIDNINQNQV